MRKNQALPPLPPLPSPLLPSPPLRTFSLPRILVFRLRLAVGWSSTSRASLSEMYSTTSSSTTKLSSTSCTSCTSCTSSEALSSLQRFSQQLEQMQCSQTHRSPRFSSWREGSQQIWTQFWLHSSQQYIRWQCRSLPHFPQAGTTGAKPTAFTRDSPQYTLRIDFDRRWQTGQRSDTASQQWMQSLQKEWAQSRMQRPASKCWSRHIRQVSVCSGPAGGGRAMLCQVGKLCSCGAEFSETRSTTSSVCSFFMRAARSSRRSASRRPLCFFGILIDYYIAFEPPANIAQVERQDGNIKSGLSGSLSAERLPLPLPLLLLLALLDGLGLLCLRLFRLFPQAGHIEVAVLLVLAGALEGLPLLIDFILLERAEGAVGAVDLSAQKARELGSIRAEAELREAAEDASHAHVVVEGGQQRLVETLLEVRCTRTHQLPRSLAPQTHPEEPQDHHVRTHVPLQHLQTALEDLGLLEGERPRVGVEARLEGVGEQPLDKGVVPLEPLVVRPPLREHARDELAVGPGGHLVEVEFHVQVLLLRGLRLQRRRRFIGEEGRAREGGEGGGEAFGGGAGARGIGVRGLSSLLLLGGDCELVALRRRGGGGFRLAGSPAGEERGYFGLDGLLAGGIPGWLH